MSRLKVGRDVLDPLNRVVTVVRITLEYVEVKLAGPYAATVRYSASALRPIP